MTDNLPSIFESTTPGAVPEHLKQYQDESAGSLVTGFVGLPSLSIRGKQFHYEKDGVEVTVPAGTAAQVVILAADPAQGVAKAWYTDAYSSGDAAPPDCASSNGITPDAFYTSPVCKSCTACPKNAFGSGTNAAGNATAGKACSDYKNLFVVLADSLNGSIYSLRVPATSLKELSRFGKELGAHKMPMHVVRTQLTFADTEHPQLIFTPIGTLSEVDAANVDKRSKSTELLMSLPSQNQTKPPAEPTVATIEPPPETTALPPPPGAMPSPPPAADEKIMTEKAGGATYESFIENGWTDEQMIEANYLIDTLS